VIQAVDLTVQSGSFTLTEVNFTAPAGAYCVLMGKTGSGKTTLLEAICGLRRVVSGKIVLAGREVTHLKPAARNIGFVPQEAALFPTMKVGDHPEFALHIRGWSAAAIKERKTELAEMLHIEHLLDRWPALLSGGEQQRVALGRALSFQPHILCLDEPLSALDDETRFEMTDLLKRVQQEIGVTALHVTHNRLEAEHLANVRLRIKDGRVEEEQAKDE